MSPILRLIPSIVADKFALIFQTELYNKNVLSDLKILFMLDALYNEQELIFIYPENNWIGIDQLQVQAGSDNL